MKELGTTGPSARLKIGRCAVSGVGVAIAATAVKINADKRLVGFMLIVITRARQKRSVCIY